MRVITGIARGKRLESLQGEAVRPTTDRVKEAIFSILHFDIEGRRMIDLFAGCGQMGIEAISRGAESVTFIDSSLSSVNVIKRNIASCGFEKQSVVFRSDYSDFLKNTKAKFDIAFLDPPYNEGILEDALEKTCLIMNDSGTILCEHPAHIELPEAVNGFEKKKVYRYGKILVSLYRKNV